MTRRVLVLGGGIAGVAAALSARAQGAEVTVVLGRAGATILSTGALDAQSWEAAEQSAGFELTAMEKEIFDALGAYVLEPSHLATNAGIVRKANGRDRALLDLGRLEGAILVLGRTASFDGRYLANALSETSGRPFVWNEEPIQRHTDEAAMADAELAVRFDSEERRAWFAKRVRAAIARCPKPVAGVLLPGVLGSSRSCAEALTELVGVPCGEILGGTNSPGARFVASRTTVFAQRGVHSLKGEASEVSFERNLVTVQIERTGEVIEADALVLAVGGLVGGGIRYAPSETRPASTLPASACATFAPNFRSDFTFSFQANGQPAKRPSSLFGEAPESFALHLTDDDSALACVGFDSAVPPHCHVAGAAAGEGGAWLRSFRSGVTAGQKASTKVRVE